jgi:uncharacterized membrane protein
MPATSVESVAPAPVVASTPAASRIDSVDLLRGIIMVVMALDHTRDYFHWSALHGTDPTDLSVTTPWIFFTRWITHFCAPVFSFIAGTGVFLSASRGKPKRELSWFLVTRGLWLIFLELTLLTWFGWAFAIDLKIYFLATLWALGTSMIVLAGLIHLPLRIVAVFSAILILGHNAFDGVRPEAWGRAAWVWQVLHVSSFIRTDSGIGVMAFYPLIPWIAVMSAGYCFGTVFQLAPEARRRWLLGLGLGLCTTFVLLRWSNLYGDLRPWSVQPRSGFTVLSFLNVTKYPPSLCYLMMTIGPAMLLLAWWDRGSPLLLKPLVVFGRVPFFYYLLHIPLIHGLAYLTGMIRFGRADFTNVIAGLTPPPEAGFGLATTYLVWASVILALYLPCRWFANLKRRRRDLAWLSYF